MSASYVQLANPKAEIARRGQTLALCIAAATGLQDVMKTNLGPKGTLKMLVNGAGDIKITKDGKFLLSEMQIQNPMAMMMARASTAQDEMTGDGTTSNLLIAAELLKLSGKYVAEGMHPRLIVSGFEAASSEALKFLEKFKLSKNADTDTLMNVVQTSIRTKLSLELADRISSIIVSAIEQIRPDDGSPIDLHMIEIQKMQTKNDVDTNLVRGLVLDHGTRHPSMPTNVRNAHILALNVSLEYEKSEVNSGFFYGSSSGRESLVESERKFVNQKLQKIVNLKNAVCDSPNKSFVIINQKGIDPLSLEILAKNGIMALRRAKRRNMERLQLCCGCTALNSVEDLNSSILGYAEHVYEYVIGEDKFTFIEGVKTPKSVTILITAPNTYTISQIKDSIRDGLYAAKNLIEDKSVVPGAGALHVALYNHLNQKKMEIKSGSRVGMEIFAEALLVIPKILVQNAGHNILESIVNVLSESSPGKVVGIDVRTGKAFDPVMEGIWDNYAVHKHLLSSCSSIASNFLLIDEIIKAGKSSLKSDEPGQIG